MGLRNHGKAGGRRFGMPWLPCCSPCWRWCSAGPVRRIRPAVALEQHRGTRLVRSGDPGLVVAVRGPQDRGHRQHPDSSRSRCARNTRPAGIAAIDLNQSLCALPSRSACRRRRSTLRTEAAFEYAAELGYDGVEVMVWAESVSQDIGALSQLSRRYNVPVLSVHAPCLLISQRVWGSDPVNKLDRSVQAAERLGAQTVVVHPPFRWQRRYAEGFQRTGGMARGAQRRHGRRGEHVSVSRRPVLRIRPAVDRADAPPRWPPGRGGLGLRPSYDPWTATTPTPWTSRTRDGRNRRSRDGRTDGIWPGPSTSVRRQRCIHR